MPRHTDYKTKRYTERGQRDDMTEPHQIPKEAIEAAEAVIACGKEVIIRKERGKWVVLENHRRLVYKEP